VLGVPVGCCSTMLRASTFVHSQLLQQVPKPNPNSSVIIIAHVMVQLPLQMFPLFEGDPMKLFSSCRANVSRAVESGRFQWIFRSRSRIHRARETYFATIADSNVTVVNPKSLLAIPTASPTKAPAQSQSQSLESRSTVIVSAIVFGSVLLCGLGILGTVAFTRRKKIMDSKTQATTLFLKPLPPLDTKTASLSKSNEGVDVWFDLSIRPELPLPLPLSVAVLSQENPARLRTKSVDSQSSERDVGFYLPSEGRTDNRFLNLLNKSVGYADKKRRKSAAAAFTYEDGYKIDGESVWFQKAPGRGPPLPLDADPVRGGEGIPQGIVEERSSASSSEWYQAPQRNELYPWNEYGPLNDRLDRRYLVPQVPPTLTAADASLSRATAKVAAAVRAVATARQDQETQPTSTSSTTMRIHLFKDFFASKSSMVSGVVPRAERRAASRKGPIDNEIFIRERSELHRDNAVHDQLP
jgi:hypothetical protein